MSLIRLYQVVISPLFPPRCRFVPSCSQYALESVRRYGAFRGGWMSLKRLIKCGPWHEGGYDPVPTDK
ncbi:membrane protein insertion efficiency factor YidD [Alicyclobacillus pomorum]|uniref:membrane protein insertion efficiency factor YidD n=1 Tax=Alicyclobacillus pomorum TaxID=204470 RepID=UPI00055352CE|nr:membrane protein insertion efficiency factor YidD [Alicyclobacillus pomorum]